MGNEVVSQLAFSAYIAVFGIKKTKLIYWFEVYNPVKQILAVGSITENVYGKSWDQVILSAYTAIYIKIIDKIKY